MNRAYLTGLLFALAAYAAWGILPLYWALLRHVSPVEVLAHRVIWTLPFAAAMVGLARQWDELAGLLRRPRTMLVLAATALLIALNWWLYIWAVTNGRMLEASLGYYLTPLVTVLLGLAAFGERPKPLQWLAIMLATAGVALILIGEGLLPWVSLALAFSFGLYGALRKHVRADAAVGLFVETALLLPLFLGWLFQLLLSGRSAFLSINFSTDLLLLGSGVVTALPLLWHVAGARRLSLVALGLLFYLNPTLQFLLGVLVFEEAFSRVRLYAFCLIWAAVAIYVSDMLLRRRR